MHDLLWRATALYCPKCGSRSVVCLPRVDEDNAGVQHLCYSCGFGFMHPEGEMPYCDLSERERQQVIRWVQSRVDYRGGSLR